jgi:hypothetical protein
MKFPFQNRQRRLYGPSFIVSRFIMIHPLFHHSLSSVLPSRIPTFVRIIIHSVPFHPIVRFSRMFPDFASKISLSWPPPIYRQYATTSGMSELFVNLHYRAC